MSKRFKILTSIVVLFALGGGFFVYNKITAPLFSLNPEQIEKIIASQLPRECKIEKADDIICNELGFSELEQRVLEKHREYLELANE